MKYSGTDNSKIVKWDKASDVREIWEWVKEVVINSAKEVCVFLKVGRKKLIE